MGTWLTHPVRGKLVAGDRHGGETQTPGLDRAIFEGEPHISGALVLDIAET